MAAAATGSAQHTAVHVPLLQDAGAAAVGKATCLGLSAGKMVAAASALLLIGAATAAGVILGRPTNAGPKPNPLPEQVHIFEPGPGQMLVTWTTLGRDTGAPTFVRYGPSPDALDVTVNGELRGHQPAGADASGSKRREIVARGARKETTGRMMSTRVGCVSCMALRGRPPPADHKWQV
jgi:hypothetical protein